MNALSVAEARRFVIEKTLQLRPQPQVETVPLAQALGRVLARDALADRDYPPLDRSIRDGFALRSTDVPGTLEVIGEVRAGQTTALEVGPGQAIEIMTGAPMPPGADSVVMVEHVSREGNRVTTTRDSEPGRFVNRRGAEAPAGAVLIGSGRRLGFPHIAMLGTVGLADVPVFQRPRVSIISTGDEVVPVERTPLPHQVRNSNSHSIAAQVRRAGGDPQILPIAPDEYEATRRRIEEGLDSDLLLLSGGVSAGKYDLVEQVLADLGAEFYFTRVLIQPGQPLVFGRIRDRFFFGLPGNPGSTMVTFEVFARAALELLGGQSESRLVLTRARLTREFRHRPGLTRFLPAWVEDGKLTPVPWAGSGDIVALARSNAFLVADPDRGEYGAGEEIGVLPR